MRRSFRQIRARNGAHAGTPLSAADGITGEGEVLGIYPDLPTVPPTTWRNVSGQVGYSVATSPA
jgi:hypothetical protein